MNTQEHKAKYVVDGVTVFEGTIAYCTRDGWTGLRNGSRIDEVRSEFVEVLTFSRRDEAALRKAGAL